MKAIRVHEFGGPEVLKLEDVPDLHVAAWREGLVDLVRAAPEDRAEDQEDRDRKSVV